MQFYLKVGQPDISSQRRPPLISKSLLYHLHVDDPEAQESLTKYYKTQAR